ncbi:MAG: aminofutalosine synthase MqnE [Prevotellaceae bacterium]|jgi:aminodeoxyfutalosine synthase|nr:aminofutalosine synthase MqnE [Prevotellaceae bacterium]
MLSIISEKINSGERLTADEGLVLYQSNDLALLASMALNVKQRASGNKVFFNRNFHIEPTNVCVFECNFCSYRRSAGQEGSWDYSIDEMLDICRSYRGKPVSEVHIVGAVHPKHDLHFFVRLIEGVREILPEIHIKAFTAVELDCMIRKAGLSIEAGLNLLKKAGLGSIPGGGAEIFNHSVRRKICGSKAPAQRWLDIHEIAHKIGLPSNASMLYGHVETYADRIDHLERLRNLQDRTAGFNAFIPLKYKSANNAMNSIGEVNAIETLKNFAVCRLFLDNIPHIKSYWPMLGKGLARMALEFGADDMDGTIDDSTKIYSMAGSDEISPAIDLEQMTELIAETGFIPIERDSLYGELKILEDSGFQEPRIKTLRSQL